MTVYADILFLVNLYVDFLLLSLTASCLRLKAKTIRLFLAAVLGGAFSLVFLLPIERILVYPISILFSFAMAATAFSGGELKFPLKAGLCLLLLSMFFGGVTALIAKVIGTRRIMAIGGTVYYDISPITFITITAAAYFLSRAAIKLLGRRRPDTEYIELIIENGGKAMELRGIIDTGNSLKEPFSGEAVITAELAKIKELLPEDVLAYAEKRKLHGGKGFRLIPYQSLGGGGLLPAFKPGSIKEKQSGKELECWLAVNSGSLRAEGADCIVPPTALLF